MVMEPADHRGRGQHAHQHGPGMPPPQQQHWGAYPPPQHQHHQHQQGRGQQMPPHMMMQAGFANGPYGPIPVPFQGPLLFAVNGAAVPAAHLMAMHGAPHPAHMWPGQASMHHHQQQQHLQQQAQMQAAAAAAAAARRARQQQQQQQAGAAFGQQPAPAAAAARPGALQGAAAAAAGGGGGASAATAAAAASKSAAAAVLQQGRTAGTARQALAAGATAGAGGDAMDSTSSPAMAQAASAVRAGSPADMDIDGPDLAAAAAAKEDDAASVCTETGDWAESNEPPEGDGSSESGWAWLVDGVLQQVVSYLHGNSSSLSAFRATCTHWRNCSDATMQMLSPKALLPKDLIRLFPTLQHLQLVSCRNVRNRDLYVLANRDLHLTSLVLGDDSNKPWVTNRGIESIAKMSSLKFLALHDCNSITNNGITAMSALTGLDKLSLRGCRKLTNNGMGTIKELTNVTTLNLYGCKRLSDAGVEPLQSLPLVALALGQTRVRDEGVAKLSALTRLTELHLVREELREQQGLRSLGALTRLEVLSLRDMRLTNHSAVLVLTMLTNLRDLSLYRNPDVSDALLLKSSIMAMTNLTALDLRETGVGDAGVQQCSQLLSLRVLKLKPSVHVLQTQFGNTIFGYPSVQDLTQLTSLCVALPVLGPNMMEALGRLTRLRDLDVGRGYVAVHKVGGADDEPLLGYHYANIAKLTGLTSLDISRRRVVDAKHVHEMMAALPRLRYINLGSTGIRPQGRSVRDLEKAHPTVTVDVRRSMAESTPDLANFGLAGTLCVL